ncbi:hypothetical protein LCGC14_2589180 [marine sediment metagenome]|uniref:Uncharacterized protein n=1 Tax=marine sediment metagenome TaxID=412755 RepID=A0A0F9B006_9ZZZZ
MVKIIIIKTSGDLFSAVTTLNRIKRRLPMMVRKGMMRWGKILARDMKLSARKAGIKKFSGTLQGLGIRWEQGVRSDTGYLFMRLYAVYLDSMAPHYVNITRRRSRLLIWAKKAKSLNTRRKARMVEKRELKSFAIYVKPHPFIAQGYRRARPKLRPVLKRLAVRGISV